MLIIKHCCDCMDVALAEGSKRKKEKKGVSELVVLLEDKDRFPITETNVVTIHERYSCSAFRCRKLQH